MLNNIDRDQICISVNLRKMGDYMTRCDFLPSAPRWIEFKNISKINYNINNNIKINKNKIFIL